MKINISRTEEENILDHLNSQLQSGEENLTLDEITFGEPITIPGQNVPESLVMYNSSASEDISNEDLFELAQSKINTKIAVSVDPKYNQDPKDISYRRIQLNVLWRLVSNRPDGGLIWMDGLDASSLPDKEELKEKFWTTLAEQHPDFIVRKDSIDLQIYTKEEVGEKTLKGISPDVAENFLFGAALVGKNNSLLYTTDGISVMVVKKVAPTIVEPEPDPVPETPPEPIEGFEYSGIEDNLTV